MSVEHAKALFEKIKNDNEFKSKVFAATTVSDRLAVITEAGFSCSIEEISEAGNLISETEDVSAGDWCLIDV